MKFKTRDTVMFLCLCLFALSAVIAPLNEETGILLLVASSGVFILGGLLSVSTKEHLPNADRKR